MTAGRLTRWVAGAVPLSLAAGALAGACAMAQSPSAAEPSVPPALAAEVSEIIGQVEDVRELGRTGELDWRLADKEVALAQQLAEDTSDPETMDRLHQDELILTRLGLLPEGTDLLQLTVDTLQGQVAGFFDPKTKQLTVLDDDGELDLASRITLAHEADHALGDQWWDLEAMMDAIPKVEGDRVAALQALVEGDATLLMSLWAAKYASDDVMNLGSAGLPGGESLGGLPQVIQRQLLYPYLDGMVFLMRAWGPGGWDAVNAIWDAPPISSEQVMHPEKYPDELPIEVTLPDVAAALGEGWTQTGETVMGEVTTGILVADGADWDPTQISLSGSSMPNAEAAAGWGGDRLVTVDGPDGAWALVWQTAWDTDQDALEFFDAAGLAFDDLPYAVAMSSDDITGTDLTAPVVITIASDEATKDSVLGALGLGVAAG